MGKTRKDLVTKAPWRGDDDEEAADKFKDVKLKVTSEPGSTPTIHVPRKKKGSKYDDLDDNDLQLDPQLRYSFHRNYQFLQRVFSIDIVVKPLPPSMAYNVSHNLNFFTRVFTQFFGIAKAQRSLGLGQEEKARHVRRGKRI